MTEAALVSAHLDLVKRIAHHLAARLPASVDVDDLVQAGVIGLIEAARHYSGDRGASFETYAGIRIRGAMMDELRRGDWAPRSVHRRARDVASAIREIEQSTGREARDGEVAGKLGIPLSEYHEIVRDATQCQVLSIDGYGSDDEDEHSIDAASGDAMPDEAVERDAFQGALAKAIAELPERERLVMSLYYDDELNLREIGEVLEVTESRVCQLHGQALLRLRGRLTGWFADGAPAEGRKRKPGRPRGRRASAAAAVAH
jgi:RNA polymerase sigma factor for flagellar operon FliA